MKRRKINYNPFFKKLVCLLNILGFLIQKTFLPTHNASCFRLCAICKSQTLHW